MEYQNIINLLDNTTNQPSKFRTRNWVEINNESRAVCNIGGQIKFKTSMLGSSLCDYSDAYILVKGTVTVLNTAGAGAAVNNTNKKVIFKNYAPFTNCISKTNNTQVDDAQDIDTAMYMYNLIEYSAASSKTLESLWEYYRDEPALDNNDNITDFSANDNDSVLFKFKQQITGQIGSCDTKDVEIMVPLNYLSNFWRTLEMPLINCEISFQLKWSKDCFLIAGTAANQVPEIKITDT